MLGLGLGILATTGAPPQYQASVTFFVTTSSEPTASAAVQGDEFAQRRVNSYLELLGTDRFAEMVAAAAVDVDLTADQVEGMIGAKGDIDTVLFTATVTSDLGRWRCRWRVRWRPSSSSSCATWRRRATRRRR